MLWTVAVYEMVLWDAALEGGRLAIGGRGLAHQGEEGASVPKAPVAQLTASLGSAPPDALGPGAEQTAAAPQGEVGWHVHTIMTHAQNVLCLPMAQLTPDDPNCEVVTGPPPFCETFEQALRTSLSITGVVWEEVSQDGVRKQEAPTNTKVEGGVHNHPRVWNLTALHSRGMSENGEPARGWMADEWAGRPPWIRARSRTRAAMPSALRDQVRLERMPAEVRRAISDQASHMWSVRKRARPLQAAKVERDVQNMVLDKAFIPIFLRLRCMNDDVPFNVWTMFGSPCGGDPPAPFEPDPSCTLEERTLPYSRLVITVLPREQKLPRELQTKSPCETAAIMRARPERLLVAVIPHGAHTFLHPTTPHAATSAPPSEGDGGGHTALPPIATPSMKEVEPKRRKEEQARETLAAERQQRMKGDMDQAYEALVVLGGPQVPEASRGYLPDSRHNVPLQKSHVDGLDASESHDAACLTSGTVRTEDGNIDRRAVNCRCCQMVKVFAAAEANGPSEIMPPTAALLLTHNGVDPVTGEDGAADHDNYGIVQLIGPGITEQTRASKRFVCADGGLSTPRELLRDNLVLTLLAGEVNEARASQRRSLFDEHQVGLAKAKAAAAAAAAGPSAAGDQPKSLPKKAATAKRQTQRKKQRKRRAG